MKPRRPAKARLVGAVLGLLMLGAEPWQGGMATADVAKAAAPPETLAEGPPAVQSWPACEAWRGGAASTKLCRGPGKEIETLAHRYLSDQLHRTVRHVSALCEIDDLVVQALRECTSDGFPLNVAIIASLMGQLAQNWERHEVLKRADLLYEKAYAVYGRQAATEYDLFKRMKVAERWMRLKLRLGDDRSAKELAYVQAELARWRHDTGRSPNVHLIEALERQAEILDEVGEAATARAIRSEAEALAAMPTRCPFYCDLERDGTISGVREKR